MSDINQARYAKAQAGVAARKQQLVKDTKRAKHSSRAWSFFLTLAAIVIILTVFGLVNDEDGNSYLSGAIYWTLHLPWFGDLKFVQEFAATWQPFSSPIQQSR